jgi:hypothetical protein
MRFRASGAAPLFLGTDGLTEVQKRDLNELLNKIKLTDIQAAKRDDLIKKRDAEPTLTAGAVTYVRSIVDKEVYNYQESFSNRSTDKGTEVEEESISIYNRLFFTDHKKLNEGDEYVELFHGSFTGHPDVVDVKNLRIIDIKSSETKKSFPKLPEDGENTTYEWQVKLYLYMLRNMTGLDWRSGEYTFVLANTPEGLVSDWEEPSLHYMDDVQDNLRVTVVPVTLTDDDINHIERREKAALKFADEYKSKLINKNGSVL